MHIELGLVSPVQEPSQESLARLADRLWECKFLIYKTQELQRHCAQARSEKQRIISESRAQLSEQVADAWGLSARQCLDDSAPKRREAASERRCRELFELAQEGLPIKRISRWQSRVGPLHIWPYAGRWLNTITGRRGKLKSVSMRLLIVRELSSHANSGFPARSPGPLPQDT